MYSGAKNVMFGMMLIIAVVCGTTSASGGIGDGHDLRSPLFAGDPRLEDCFDDQGRLTMDARGTAVRMIKFALMQLGYDLGPNAATDLYDFATWEAVRKFKKDQRLGFEQYGDVGPGTMARLDLLFAPVAPTPPAPPPASQPRPSVPDTVVRAGRALPLISKPGPQRRLSCVVAKISATGVIDGYFDFQAASRVPGSAGWPQLTPAQQAAVIADITRHVIPQLQSVAGLPADADMARGMEAIDEDIGRNIANFQTQLGGDSSTGAWMRVLNASIGVLQTDARAILSCYADYSRIRHDL